MKITLGKLAGSISVLQSIKEQATDFKVSYWIMRNLKILSDSFNFFIATREEIYSKYCNKTFSDEYPQGTYFTVLNDGNVKFNLKENIDITSFDKEMNELMNMPCDDIEPYLLDLETINSITNVKITTDDICTIDYLLSE